MSPITEKQQAVMSFIINFRLDHGYAPTTREITQEFKFKSQTSAVNHIRALEHGGWITSKPGQQRTIVPVGETRTERLRTLPLRP